MPEPTRADSEREQERTVREGLAARLAPGEELLGSFVCAHNPGGWRATRYWAGLTGQRFLLVAEGPAGAQSRVYSLPQDLIREIRFQPNFQPRGFGFLPEAGVLRLRLGPDELVLGVRGQWCTAARGVAQSWAANPPQPAESAFEESLFQHSPLLNQSMALLLAFARDLHDLGLLNLARDLLRRQLDSDPLSTMHPGGQALLRQIQANRWAMRIVALLILAMTGFQVYAVWHGCPAAGLSILLLGTTVFGLLRGQPAARTLVLLLGVLLAALNVAFNVSLPAAAEAPLALPSAVLWGAFGAALLLLLAVRPVWTRVAAGGGVFTLALTGVLAVLMVPFLLPALPVTIFQPQGTEKNTGGMFLDDFARERGWPAGTLENVRLDLREGGYAIRVTSPGEGYYAVPPVNIHADQIQVDALVTQGIGGANPGAYGAVCRLNSSSSPAYFALINPSEGTFTILAQDAQGAHPLIDPAWQPAPGLNGPGQSDRLRMRCAGAQIDLWLNEEQLGEVAAPAMQNGSGLTGLVVQSFDSIPLGGLQVVFDNAVIWPEAGQ
jgi:hypothetical protein